MHFLIFREVVHDDVEHEPVELRFGQRIRAFELDRVLRREDVERLLELERLALHRDAMLLHRLEQRRLRLRRRAVDFVGQHDVREDRSGREHHVPASRLGIVLNDVRAGDVARHQVRRELDARELEIEHLRDRVDEQRLRQSRHADDQTVAAGEQRQQHELDHVLLADDELVQLGDDLVVTGLESVGERDVVGGFQSGSRGCVVAKRSSLGEGWSESAACSVRQRVDDVIDAQLVRLVRRGDRDEARGRPLP